MAEVGLSLDINATLTCHIYKRNPIGVYTVNFNKVNIF